ncbi:hypothetical protein DF17_13360 [Streptomyces rimosus]|nr:hypothetical protein DF17_13360 [Streptomyces rimosus]
MMREGAGPGIRALQRSPLPPLPPEAPATCAWLRWGGSTTRGWGCTPSRLIREARSPIGRTDTVTRMDRIEPAITEATPGDPRDTTSPWAFGADYRKVVLGNVLAADKRAFLRDLLECNTTGAQRIRAAVPRGWTVADKTGTGNYGTLNDIDIVWHTKSAPPLLNSLMSSKSTKDAAYDQALIADAAAYVVDTLG